MTEPEPSTKKTTDSAGASEPATAVRPSRATSSSYLQGRSHGTSPGANASSCELIMVPCQPLSYDEHGSRAGAPRATKRALSSHSYRARGHNPEKHAKSGMSANQACHADTSALSDRSQLANYRHQKQAGVADLTTKECLALKQQLPRTGQFRGPLLASGCRVRGIVFALVKYLPAFVVSLHASGRSKLIQRNRALYGANR